MSEIQVIENLIPKKLQDEIEKWISSEEVDWRFLETSAPNIFPNDLSIFNTWQLTHPFFNRGVPPSSGFNAIVIPMLYNLKLVTGLNFVQKMGRIKANALFKNANCGPNNYNPPHVDSPNPNYKSLLYYVNDSDGDTFIFNEVTTELPGDKNYIPPKLTLNQRVTPKKGTAIMFNSNRYHASSSPKKSDRRYVINFVFTE